MSRAVQAAGAGTSSRLQMRRRKDIQPAMPEGTAASLTRMRPGPRPRRARPRARLRAPPDASPCPGPSPGGRHRGLEERPRGEPTRHEVLADRHEQLRLVRVEADGDDPRRERAPDVLGEALQGVDPLEVARVADEGNPRGDLLSSGRDL